MNNNLLVSVCMITYNHASFVREAIEGVLSQKTHFKFELIISDDVSSDNTREICESYQRDYPEIIRLVFREQNLGICKNFYQTLSLAKGQYVAVCEGDDYWTDPYKLQKQIDYLSVHPSAIMLYHNAVVDTDGRKSLFIPLKILSDAATSFFFCSSSLFITCYFLPLLFFFPSFPSLFSSVA